MLNNYFFIDVVNLIKMLGVFTPLFLSILKRLRREELSCERIMDIWSGKMKNDSRFFVSIDTFKKMSCDLEMYVALLALLSNGQIKIRDDLKKIQKSFLLNKFRHLRFHGRKRDS